MLVSGYIGIASASLLPILETLWVFPYLCEPYFWDLLFHTRSAVDSDSAQPLVSVSNWVGCDAFGIIDKEVMASKSKENISYFSWNLLGTSITLWASVTDYNLPRTH